ncbi:MAG: hypothetical protein F4Y02_01945 [Chloroflexi bacterium]|nr:hypothetical protein [Chloroflexota bacterium]
MQTGLGVVLGVLSWGPWAVRKTRWIWQSMLAGSTAIGLAILTGLVPNVEAPSLPFVTPVATAAPVQAQVTPRAQPTVRLTNLDENDIVCPPGSHEVETSEGVKCLTSDGREVEPLEPAGKGGEDPEQDPTEAPGEIDASNFVATNVCVSQDGGIGGFAMAIGSEPYAVCTKDGTAHAAAGFASNSTNPTLSVKDPERMIVREGTVYINSTIPAGTFQHLVTPTPTPAAR